MVPGSFFLKPVPQGSSVREQGGVMQSEESPNQFCFSNIVGDFRPSLIVLERLRASASVFKDAFVSSLTFF